MFVPMWLIITLGVVFGVLVVVAGVVIYGLCTALSGAAQVAGGFISALTNR